MYQWQDSNGNTLIPTVKLTDLLTSRLYVDESELVFVVYFLRASWLKTKNARVSDDLLNGDITSRHILCVLWRKN